MAETRIVTIKEALVHYQHMEIEILLSKILGKTKEFLYMNPERKLSRYQVRKLSSLVERREKGEPMAYILGYKDFYGLRFIVNKHVLVPRPETEEIVHKVYQVHKVREPLRILDVGTGSGAIIVSLATSFSNLSPLTYHLTASDVSPAALEVAKKNAKIHNTKIKFIKSDLFKNISGRFDVIVSNLPYVPKNVYRSKIDNLKWEPKLALVDTVRDFDLYKKFFEQIPYHLHPKSLIYLEMDPKTKPHITSYVKKYLPGWQVKFTKDLNDLWRYAEIRRGLR